LLGNHKRVGNRARTQLNPETVIAGCLGALQRRIPDGAGRLQRQCPTEQCLFRLAGPPRTRREAAEGDTCVAHGVSIHLYSHRRGGKREGIRLPVSYLVEGRATAEPRDRDTNAQDEFVGLQHGLNVGRGPWLAMQVLNENRPLAIGPQHIDACFECG
jgi:hypothetical protein